MLIVAVLYPSVAWEWLIASDNFHDIYHHIQKASHIHDIDICAALAILASGLESPSVIKLIDVG
jgi:hypothetical protein